MLNQSNNRSGENLPRWLRARVDQPADQTDPQLLLFSPVAQRIPSAPAECLGQLGRTWNDASSATDTLLATISRLQQRKIGVDASQLRQQLHLLNEANEGFIPPTSRELAGFRDGLWQKLLELREIKATMPIGRYPGTVNDLENSITACRGAIMPAARAVACRVAIQFLENGESRKFVNYVAATLLEGFYELQKAAIEVKGGQRKSESNYLFSHPLKLSPIPLTSNSPWLQGITFLKETTGGALADTPLKTLFKRFTPENGACRAVGSIFSWYHQSIENHFMARKFRSDANETLKSVFKVPDATFTQKDTIKKAIEAELNSLFGAE